MFPLYDVLKSKISNADRIKTYKLIEKASVDEQEILFILIGLYWDYNQKKEPKKSIDIIAEANKMEKIRKSLNEGYTYDKDKMKSSNKTLITKETEDYPFECFRISPTSFSFNFSKFPDELVSMLQSYLEMYKEEEPLTPIVEIEKKEHILIEHKPSNPNVIRFSGKKNKK